MDTSQRASSLLERPRPQANQGISSFGASTLIEGMLQPSPTSGSEKCKMRVNSKSFSCEGGLPYSPALLTTIEQNESRNPNLKEKELVALASVQMSHVWGGLGWLFGRCVAGFRLTRYTLLLRASGTLPPSWTHQLRRTLGVLHATLAEKRGDRKTPTA